jgi:CheY-like chemotaxis protein
MESIGRLAGGVAHDFNNMLNVILGHVELALQQTDPSSTLHADLDQVQSAARRSADLTHQLLAFARRQTVVPQVLNLNDVVTGALKILRRLIGEDIDLVWMPGHDLWSVRVDPSQVDQLLTNLAANARDAIDGVGRITIRTENVVLDEGHCAGHDGFRPGRYALLEMTDNGRGMDQETQAHIFEPFYTTKSEGHGTGLGLATVYGIVVQNSGFVGVTSEVSCGTTIRIFLPYVAGEAPLSDTRGGAETLRTGTETILLVEDEPMVLGLSKALLERLGYAVLPASLPSEAIRLVEEHTGKIDLLVTDVVMPEMNGRDLAARLLALSPQTKCLFFSGYTDSAVSADGVLGEGVFFLQKPFSLKDLASKVRDALEST